MSALLRERRVPFAVVGAAALAAHGVSRSTGDLDILTVTGACLDEDFWDGIRSARIRVQVRRGDPDDPLAGVVRLATIDQDPVDVVVGKGAWQARIFDRARETEIDDISLPLATREDLILLKLFAGGPQDLWDVEQLLAGGDRAAVSAEVERALPDLPASCREAWARVRGGR